MLGNSFAMGNEEGEKSPEPTLLTDEGVIFEENLNTMDLSKPFSTTEVFVDSEGNEITVESSFVPSDEITTFGSSTNNASVGVWTSKVNWGTHGMSYKFDVGKSGSQWKMSNARAHDYWGVFVKFSNPSLNISRATSTNSYPAEINSSVKADIFSNAWFHIATTTVRMETTINSKGTMKLTWN
ncbi:hypothetical protein [Cytobacillus purgationiresistens]|nr:hypothetical protein [Cytobacillus purgationiresistens]